MYYQLNILNYSCDHCFLAHPKHFSFDVSSSRGFLTVMTTFDPPGFSDFCFICSYGPTKCINGVSGLNVRSHSKEKSSEIPGCAKEKFIDILYRPLFSRENPGKDNCSYLLPWTSFLLGGQGNYSDLLPLIRTAWWQSVSTPYLKKQISSQIVPFIDFAPDVPGCCFRSHRCQWNVVRDVCSDMSRCPSWNRCSHVVEHPIIKAKTCLECSLWRLWAPLRTSAFYVTLASRTSPCVDNGFSSVTTSDVEALIHKGQWPSVSACSRR